jgi:hypothetical protein
MPSLTLYRYALSLEFVQVFLDLVGSQHLEDLVAADNPHLDVVLVHGA